MKFKSLMAFSLAIGLFSIPFSNSQSIISFADNSSELSEHLQLELIEKNGVFPENGKYKDLEFYDGEFVLNNRDMLSFPSFVDLSTDPCFPPLGNQSPYGSCVGFATTYYQFSYEVNKLNGVTSTADRVIYSPYWTYNSINLGQDNGGWMSDAFTILRNYGALKLSDFNSTDYTWFPGNTNYSTNEMIPEKMEALETRLSSFYDFSLPSNGTFISDPNDTDLDTIKYLLNMGKIVTTATRTGFNYKDGYDHNNSNIRMCYRCYDYGNHAITIVGYDDDAYCDVNGNNIIEDCEKGAFKLANSYGNYGTSTDTNGFKWILYDAINAVSANTINSWESNLYGTRAQAFSVNNDPPTFWIMNVSHYDVNYVGEIEINTLNNNLADCQYIIGRGAVGGSPPFYNGNMLPATKGAGAYNGKILFDFDYWCSPITSYLSGYNWYTNFTELRDPALSNTNSIYNLKLVDNHNNILGNYGYTNDTATKYVNVSTMLGDVNYSGGLSNADCTIIQQYLLNSITLSNLQKVLADANQDGDIDMSDVVYIIQHM